MNSEEAKKAIYSFTYGVYVITSKFKQQVSCMTAVWVSQVSKEPMQVALGLSPDSATTRMIRESRVFAVNVLSRDQKDLAYALGRVTSDELDKFSNIPTLTRVTGSPILSDAIAYLDCRLVSETNVGSHLVLIGEVVEGSMLRESEPAVYRNGKIL